MNALRALGRFARDFLIGDEPRIAVGVVLVLAAGGVVVASGAARGGVLAPLLGLGLVLVFALVVLAGARDG